tara:strand:- start:648 stop:893 length:246 start_codon:yes stop_codon:yes gene_type:complete
MADHINVEECYCCGAPDPAGIAHTERSGPNIGQDFEFCRTCWGMGAVSVEFYPRQYPDAMSVKITCHIEQVRRLKEGFYDG